MKRYFIDHATPTVDSSCSCCVGGNRQNRVNRHTR